MRKIKKEKGGGTCRHMSSSWLASASPKRSALDRSVVLSPPGGPCALRNIWLSHGLSNISDPIRKMFKTFFSTANRAGAMASRSLISWRARATRLDNLNQQSYIVGY